MPIGRLAGQCTRALTKHQPVPKPTAAALAGETEVQVGETECKSHSWSHFLIVPCEEDRISSF